MHRAAQGIALVLTGLALLFILYAVLFNWATVIVNARNRRRGIPRRVSKILAAPQMLVALVAIFQSSAPAALVPYSVLWTLALVDVGLWETLRAGVIVAYRAIRANS
jgi:hypothetical protein